MKRTLLPKGVLVALVLGLAAVSAAAALAHTQDKPKLAREPVITGTASVGGLLQATTGSWDNSPTAYAYQWQRCTSGQPSSCDAIKGATKSTYTVASTDVGDSMRVVVTASNKDGSASAQSNPVGPVTSGKAPENTAAPTISGSATVGQTLTASTGQWSGTPTSYEYQWLRCDANGANCGAIDKATAKTYVVASDDAGDTLRVRVTAKDGNKSGSATSAQTPVVSTGTGGSAIPVSTISLPNRLIVSGVDFQPSVLRSRAPFTARFRVTDSKGRAVAGALVYAIGLPYGWVHSGKEQPTDSSGWATITIEPTSQVPHRGAIVFFVRARKPGENLLGGISTRRLVQVTVRM